MKCATFCLIVIMTGGALEPCAADMVIELRSVVQIDCSAYQRQSDGTWIALRQNKVMRGSDVARVIIPEDDLEVAKMTDGKLLKGLLNSVCVSTKK